MKYGLVKRYIESALRPFGTLALILISFIKPTRVVLRIGNSNLNRRTMFRKQDFKKVDLLGSGKKNTKIYKAEHIQTGKYYAIKEVEAKTLDKLNEYKVRRTRTL